MKDSGNLQKTLKKKYTAGTVLFEQGDPAGDMYIISYGKIQISRKVRHLETVLAVLSTGEFLGEMAIINNKPRSATAKVVEDAELLVIPPEKFSSMVQESSEIAVRMIKKLASRLEQATKQIEVLLFRNPSGRVLHLLQQEAHMAGIAGGSGITVPLSTTEIAEKLGLTIGVVEQVLDQLIKSNLVKQQKHGFLVSGSEDLDKFLEFLEMKEQSS